MTRDAACYTPPSEQVADEQIGHKAGDLVFVIETLPHPDFTRRNDDLHMDMDVSLVDALVRWHCHRCFSSASYWSSRLFLKGVPIHFAASRSTASNTIMYNPLRPPKRDYHLSFLPSIPVTCSCRHPAYHVICVFFPFVVRIAWYDSDWHRHLV